MPRVYTRKFDHDEARARYQAGERISDLAKAYGVSTTAVARVVDERVAQRMAEAHERFRLSGRCDVCGGQMSGHSRSTGSRRCRRCAALAQATSVRNTMLLCMTCRVWKPDEDFPRNRAERIARRGRHTQCRACATVSRREYRNRSKQPCVDCGAPALPPSEKGLRGWEAPRCRSCFHEWQRLPEQRAAASARAKAQR